MEEEMTPDYLKGSIIVGEDKGQPDYLKGSKEVKRRESKSFLDKAKDLGQGLKELVTSPEETPLEHGLGVAGRGALSTVLGAPGEFVHLMKGFGKGVASLLGLPTSSPEQ